MNKIGPTLELCGATDAIFSHELQKYFAFLAFCFLNGLYSKASLPCLIVRGSEIAGMGLQICLNPYLLRRRAFSSKSLANMANDKVK